MTDNDKMRDLIGLGGDALDIQPNEPHTHTEDSDPLECRGCWSEYLFGAGEPE